MNTAEGLAAIFDEMRGVFARMPADAPAQLASEIAKARRILVYGVGRNGLVLQSFTMRLMHLGPRRIFRWAVVHAAYRAGRSFVHGFGARPAADRRGHRQFRKSGRGADRSDFCKAGHCIGRSRHSAAGADDGRSDDEHSAAWQPIRACFIAVLRIDRRRTDVPAGAQQFLSCGAAR